jgi:hypothetical protein
MARPIPEVEPVTRPDLPFSMGSPVIEWVSARHTGQRDIGQ